MLGLKEALARLHMDRPTQGSHAISAKAVVSSLTPLYHSRRGQLGQGGLALRAPHTRHGGC